VVRRYVVKIAYDGTGYAGWQRQKNAVSVQEKLEEAVYLALGERVNITASGRTDAGVHAVGQTCHFDSENISVPPEKMPDCLNRFLPTDIRVLGGQGVDETFDCNRNAKRKTYCYTLYASPREMPLLERYAVRIENAPSVSVLEKKAKLMEGEHDFKAFCASGSSVKTTVRTVYEVKVEETETFGSRDIKIFVTGNGFLQGMVRIIVGTLLEVGTGVRHPEQLPDLFGGKRAQAGFLAPAQGLCLMEVFY
jgi:tRNA pseudouridine38-40 synthase